MVLEGIIYKHVKHVFNAKVFVIREEQHMGNV